jgi:hypothetical protein
MEIGGAVLHHGLLNERTKSHAPVAGVVNLTSSGA